MLDSHHDRPNVARHFRQKGSSKSGPWPVAIQRNFRLARGLVFVPFPDAHLLNPGLNLNPSSSPSPSPRPVASMARPDRMTVFDDRGAFSTHVGLHRKLLSLCRNDRPRTLFLRVLAGLTGGSGLSVRKRNGPGGESSSFARATAVEHRTVIV